MLFFIIIGGICIRKSQLKSIFLWSIIISLLLLAVVAISQNISLSNRPLIVTRIKTYPAVEGNWTVVLVHAEDPDGDNLTITYPEPFDEFGSWKPKVGDAGNYTFNILVSDGFNFINQEFNISVEPCLSNCPIIQGKVPELNISINETNDSKATFATTIDGVSIYDDPYIDEYLNNFNLNTVLYLNITDYATPLILKADHFGVSIDGYTLGNKHYAIHLIACSRERNSCNLRINSLLFKDVSPENNHKINLDGNYSINIKSIIFDYCDERKVCDYMYQAHDILVFEFIEKKVTVD